jgi:hypothetical protein
MVLLLLSCLLEEFFLLTKIEIITALLVLSQLLFPLLALLTTTVRAREAIELLGVRYLKGVQAMLTAKCNLGGIETIHDR